MSSPWPRLAYLSNFLFFLSSFAFLYASFEARFTTLIASLLDSGARFSMSMRSLS
jgi:hypothetical protein